MSQFPTPENQHEPVRTTPTGAPRLLDTSEVVSQLNSFLRGEISAAEAYRMAIDRARESDSGGVHVARMHEIRLDHGRAAQRLRERIRSLGGDASDSSGAWGGWAKFIQGTANMLGETASLKALKEGEEHGLHDYNAGISDVDDVSSELIAGELVPLQQRHINLLDQMMNAPGDA